MVEKTADIKGWLFITGVILVGLFSIIIGYLNFGVLFLLGTPILGLLVGIIFVWAGKANLRNKLIVTAIPIPLIVAAFFLEYSIHKAEPEIFLIPNALRGEIVVFYDEPCGRSPVYRDGRRVYEVSPEGVLITRFTKNSGYLDQKFYSVDSENGETEIPYFQRQDFETERKEWSFTHSGPVENFTKETVGAFYAYGSGTYRLSQNSFSFIVSDYRYFDRDEKDRWLERKRLSEQATKLLNDCRLTKE